MELIYIYILTNLENDETYAVILDPKTKEICSYSRIGQHSSISPDYIRESNQAIICDVSIDLWNEIKTAYYGYEPVLENFDDLLNVIDNENLVY